MSLDEYGLLTGQPITVGCILLAFHPCCYSQVRLITSMLFFIVQDVRYFSVCSSSSFFFPDGTKPFPGQFRATKGTSGNFVWEQ